MKRIASRDNASFKALRRWTSDAAARRDDRVAVLEGVHLADAYLSSGGTPRQIVVGESAERDAQVIDVLRRAEAGSSTLEIRVFGDALFAGLTQLAEGVALLMVVDRPTPVLPDRLVRGSVLLDRVQDPGNVGSILRSAAAAGLPDVYLSRECAGAWSPKVLRAAMGAHFGLTLHEDCDLPALRAASTIPWIATSPHAERSMYDVDLRGDVAWLFGHEGQGLAAGLQAAATNVSIPQPGTGESLNVAASAAVCFFEQVRQRRTG